jgi:hypothetical protein
VEYYEQVKAIAYSTNLGVSSLVLSVCLKQTWEKRAIEVSVLMFRHMFEISCRLKSGKEDKRVEKSRKHMHTTGFNNSSRISCAFASLESITLAGSSASIKIWRGSLKCS